MNSHVGLGFVLNTYSSTQDLLGQLTALPMQYSILEVIGSQLTTQLIHLGGVRFGLDLRLYCLKCTKFGQLILWKIIKIVATRCHILRLPNSISAGAPPQTPLRQTS